MAANTPEKFPKALNDLALEEYVLSHSDPEPEVLRRVAYRAEQELVFPRMVSGHLQGRFLEMLVRLLRPRLVLELGTFAGYATIALASGLEEGAKVLSVEIDPDLEPFIRKSLSDARVEDRVELLFGDTSDLLRSGRIPVSALDLVYIDANKRHYLDYYEALIPSLRSGTLILADNVLWGGKVADPEAHDLQTQGIRAFNDFVRDDPRVDKVILPLRDGLTLIRVRSWEFGVCQTGQTGRAGQTSPTTINYKL